jgi:hypothetical protein
MCVCVCVHAGVFIKNLKSAPVWLTIDWGGDEIENDGRGNPEIRVDVGTKWDLDSFYSVKGCAQPALLFACHIAKLRACARIIRLCA